MKLSFSSDVIRSSVFDSVEKFLLSNKFNISNKDAQRPWGGFFVIDEKQSSKFIQQFFSDVAQEEIIGLNKISPKILIVEPEKRLSWQYHFRRAELWKIISGDVSIVTSETNTENEAKRYSTGSLIKLRKGERHRLIGLETWGIVAEIWQHTDNNKPSDEEDIIRLQDDYGR